MLKKCSTIAACLLLAASIIVTHSDTAGARYRHRGVYIGGAALGLFALGATARRSSYGYARERCYRGPCECRWVRGSCYRDRFGEYDCEDGYRECSRPLYCD
jgi:hypothetical protein